MARKRITFQKLQEFISRYDFEKLEKQHFTGRSASRGFSQTTHFKIIAFGIIEGIKTLRECVTRFNTYKEYFYHLGIKKEIPLSTLSEANTKRTSEFYRNLFFLLLNKTHRKLKKELMFALKILDSTTISIFDKRAAWAKFRKNKFGIKVHVLIDQSLTLVESIKVTTASCADVKIATSMAFKRGNMYVMDRAYFDAKWLYKLNENGVFFTMRLKSNIIYHTLREDIFNAGNVVSVKTIQFIGPCSEQYFEHLRLVKLLDEKTGKVIEVITNNIDLTAAEISDIYRKRWDIELFFRWLKQNLQVKRFYGRSENAMKNQIWIAMIVYLLLWNFHRFTNEKEAFIVFIRKFKSRLFMADPVEKRQCPLQKWLLPEFQIYSG